MKELLPGETYSRAYVAIPITESPLFRWVQSINGNKKFYHLTILFLGTLNDAELPKIREAMSKLPSFDEPFAIVPERLGFIGDKKGVFVLKIQKTDELEEVREILEKSLPKNSINDRTFIPHITIKRAKWGEFSKYDIGKLLSINDRSKYLDPFEAKSVGLYYRTEEGATALLFSKKYNY